MKPSRNNITVFEHESLKVGQVQNGVEFSQHHLASLEKFLGDKGTPYFRMIHHGVRFCEFVGVLQVGNLTIEVLPKADRDGDRKHWRDVLIGMLRKVGMFDITAPSEANLKIKPNHLLDLYFELFINEVEYLVHLGLVKKYRKDECNLYSLKGSLYFSRHIRDNLVHQERFYTRHTVYDRENLFNQVIYKAIHLVKDINTNPSLSSRIGAMLLDFPEMSDVRVSEAWFNAIVFSRKTEHYRKAIDIARLLLLNYHPDISRGRDHVLALMFDMNLLWEKFVYVSLRKHLPADQIRAQSSKPYWKLDDHRPVRLKPDIVINKGDQTFVIDTKWKVLNNDRPSDEDLRQMYAYTRYFKADHTLLCYPGEDKYQNGYFFAEESETFGSRCSIIRISMDKANTISTWQSRISTSITCFLNRTETG
jgi:5-methylcytosine-specific restriction enzyme subunit McrC